MMSGEHKNLDYQQLVEALRRICREGRTGTMFICTDENQALRFVLENGRVVGCTYRRKHGREALPLIQDVKAGRYSFSEGMFMTEEVPMPEPAVLFQLLEKQHPAEEQMERDALRHGASEPRPPDTPSAAESAKKEDHAAPTAAAPPPVAAARPEPVPEAAPPPPPDPAPAASPQAPPAAAAKSQTSGLAIPKSEELYSLVESRLALLMGPIGPIIASQYADAANEVETEEQLLALIDQVRMEIPDETQSLEFRRMVLEDLR